MPATTGYGYSGAGPKSDTNVKVIMAGAVGLGVGGAVGVGGYQALHDMLEHKKSDGDFGITGTAFDQSWCRAPDDAGSLLACRECFEVHGSKCVSENKCFTEAGCDFKLPTDMERDDIMVAGFVPDFFDPPLQVTIKKIDGPDFTKDKVCPKAVVKGSFGDAWAKSKSLDVNVFMTLTQVEQLAIEQEAVRPSVDLAHLGGPALSTFLTGILTLIQLARHKF